MNEPNNNPNNVNNENNGNVLPAGATFVVPGQETQPTSNNNVTLGTVINNQQPQGQVVNPEPVNSAPMPGTLASMVNNQAPVVNEQAPVVNPAPAEPVNPPQSAPAGISSLVNATPVENVGAPVETPGVVNQPGQNPPAPQPASPAPNVPEENNKKKFFDSSKKSNIIALILLILIFVGGIVGALFLFVFDSPTKAFSKAYDDFLAATDVNGQMDNNTYYNYDLSISVSSGNEVYKDLIDLINKFKFNFTIGKDENSRAVMLGLFSYDNDELINFSSLVDNGVAYIKLNNLLDKVIKLDINSETEEDEGISFDYDFDLADYNVIRIEFFKALKETLNQVKYDKTMTKYNGSNVKKYSFNVDTDFTTILYNKLANNQEFVNSLKKISGEEDVLSTINSALQELAGKGYTASVYAGLFKGDIQAISIANATDEIVIVPSDGSYKIEIYQNGTMLYTASFVYSRSGDDVSTTISFGVVSDGTTVSIRSLRSKMDAPEIIDITEAVGFDELTETEIESVTEKLENNAGVVKISEAISNLMMQSFDESSDWTIVYDDETITDDMDLDED